MSTEPRSWAVGPWLALRVTSIWYAVTGVLPRFAVTADPMTIEPVSVEATVFAKVGTDGSGKSDQAMMAVAHEQEREEAAARVSDGG